MKLYGVCLSPYVRKVAAVLSLKGLAFEHDNAMPGALPREISPLGKIPALVDGDLRLADSSVICEYLDERYPQAPTMPRDAAERARARWLEEFADSKLGELCGGGIFFERVVKKMLMGQDCDEAKVRNTIDNLLPPMLDYLEGELPAEGFLFGAPMTADFAIVTHLVNAGYAGYQPEPARWPRLCAFIERVKSVPAMQAQLAVDAAFMKQLAGG